MIPLLGFDMSLRPRYQNGEGGARDESNATTASLILRAEGIGRNQDAVFGGASVKPWIGACKNGIAAVWQTAQGSREVEWCAAWKAE
jgi:hypothetical protein